MAAAKQTNKKKNIKTIVLYKWLHQEPYSVAFFVFLKHHRHCCSLFCLLLSK